VITSRFPKSLLPESLVSIDPNYAGFTAPLNNFKNITVLAGNVQLSPGDTYQHFFTTGSTQIVWGINVQPGNQNSNSK
jgi:hypothetical protein